MTISFSYGQTTYYWVGGAGVSPANITTAANWNTSLDGTGSPRPSNLPSTGGTDILIFDGTNTGGTTPTTGIDSVNLNASISCSQMKFVNNANFVFIRVTSGTSTVIVSGDAGEDFIIESGSTLSLNSYTGSTVIWMQTGTTGRVSGDFNMITILQARICNTNNMAPLPPPVPATLVFTSGSNFRTNITAASAAYAFGNSSQSTQKWTSFEAGSHLYYLGGYSPNGSGNLFSAIEMKPGSVWHHRANNPVSGFGNFFNRQGYGDIIVENNSTLTALGSLYRIENLTVDAGSTFIPHTSGQTAVVGNVVVNGSFANPASGTNKLVLAGNAAQSISGSGAISLGGLTLADKANVTLNTNIAVDATVDVYGKLNFTTNQLTGNASFNAAGVEPVIPSTGNLITGAFFITGNTIYNSSSIGKTINGTGIAPNTEIVSFSTSSDSVYLSQPLLATAAGVSLTATNSGATLVTANANGFDPSTGSAATSGNKTYGDSINYIINAATAAPFGISTGSSASTLLIGFAEINAPVTVNKGLKIQDYLLLNAKMTLRPLDTLHIAAGSVINGSFNSSNYIVTGYNSVNGDQSVLRYDGIASSITLPIGTTNYYLPVTLNPSSISDFRLAVFEGITSNGTITGTPLTPAQKQTVVNAVWNINRLNGSGNSDLQLNWNAALEGSTFTTLPNSDIGLIANTGSSWALPIGAGDNIANTATATVSSFGSFSAGAVPPTQPFIFNPLPTKTYGDADFNGGATSLNTTQPIIYTSSNTSVATIVAGNIHIVGAGTSDITASQASDGLYPAANVTQTLTVNKANLTIKADDKIKFELVANPTLTATYTGFVYNETSAVLLTPVVLSTTAVLASPPGTYPITVTGATAANYNISFVDAVLTVQAKQNQTITFNALPAKTYGNADFAAGATSTNNTIPITYTSSNTGVATIVGNTIHIVGAGTSTITVSQAGNDGYFPAANVARTLTVNKAALTIRVRDTTKVQGEVNPPFTITYTGFVLGETSANLTSPVVVSTLATTNSAAGYYTLTPDGAATNNYNITYINGRLTIFPVTGTDKQSLHAFMSNNDILSVRVFSITPALGDVVIYDRNGRPLLKRNIYMPPGFINVDLFISTLPSGIYIVTVRGDGVDLKKRIAIMKN